ncbi:hypothetical protein LF95_05785 [Thalassospira sp. TSL5-1]|nr:hypothetical protein LF95_05785 [Thalassospira sp. TSL5-1]
MTDWRIPVVLKCEPISLQLPDISGFPYGKPEVWFTVPVGIYIFFNNRELSVVKYLNLDTMLFALSVSLEQALMRTATLVYVFESSEIDFNLLEKNPAIQFPFCPIQPSAVGVKYFTLVKFLKGILLIFAKE